MPPKPPGDLIREQGEEIARLVQRMDHLQIALDKIETKSDEDRRFSREIDRQSAVTKKDVESLEKKLDETLSRRWDLWKLFMAAILSLIFGLVGGLIAKLVDRPFQ